MKPPFSHTSIICLNTYDGIVFGIDSRITHKNGRVLDNKYEKTFIFESQQVLLGFSGSNDLFENYLKYLRHMPEGSLAAGFSVLDVAHFTSRCLSNIVSAAVAQLPRVGRIDYYVRLRVLIEGFTSDYFLMGFNRKLQKFETRIVSGPDASFDFSVKEVDEKIITAGSGRNLINEILEGKGHRDPYYMPLRINDARELAKAAIEHASLWDWGTGGNINVFCLRKKMNELHTWPPKNENRARLGYDSSIEAVTLWR